MENDPNTYGPPPASKSALDSLIKKDISEFINMKTECFVCLTPIGELTVNELEALEGEDRQIVEMPCDHTFHSQCLMPWLKQHNSCPTCRFELPTDDPDYEQRKIRNMNNQAQARVGTEPSALPRPFSSVRSSRIQMQIRPNGGPS